ncbi:hypothetical protein [Marivirga sp.]|uniref:hypothetical protein n=1 Tax=Marivirga sp. TaxID=2018662 RepID=UPI002D7EE41E|nr:hypothetical protein [Marivirga sp.]HET8860845.1 hypothetical protein [Marivirga sp.]
MKQYLLLLFLFSTTVFITRAEDTYFRGFYHGENVYIRNPYLDSEAEFCIQAIYLNGNLVIENPKVSAYQIDMKHLDLDSRVVIRIVHQAACIPELINAEVIKDDLKFDWLKVYVDEEQIIWITTKESKDGFYIVERDSPEGWMHLDTIKTKGGIFINQHSIEIEHIKGDNLYRVEYHEPKMEVDYSENFNFHSDKVEITHVIDEEKWIIEFSQEVSYVLYDNSNRVIKRGKDVSCNIRNLPNGRYMVKYDGKEVYFDKK